MGKKKNKGNNDCNNNSNNGGGNKENSGVIVVVLKVDLHCEGCAGKVVKAIRSLDGVDSVRIGDCDLNKLTVTGRLDPAKLRQKVEEKTKKKVEIISPAAKKDKSDNDGGEDANKKLKQQLPPQNQKTADNKDEKKPKELPVTTAVLKVPLHCQGCIQKIHKLVSKTKGIMEKSIDKDKDLVTVKGTMDVKALTEALKEKLKRSVEILPPKKDGGDGGDKKGKGGGEKKSKGGADGGDRGEGNDGADDWVKVEGYKMEHHGGQGEFVFDPQYVYGPGYMVNYVHAPQLFSDENPNACTVM